MIRKFIFSIFFILLLALALRVILLDIVPIGITNDEIDYLLSSKSVFLSGSDISHTWNPFTFTNPKSGNLQAEIPPILTFWLIGPFPLGMFTSKIIYALFSTGIVGLIYLIARKLLGKNEAFISGLVAAFNPWLIFFGRTAYDTPLAIFFFLLGFYSLLVFKKWKILLVFPMFFIAFYSYIGTKLLMLPFTAATIYYAWNTNKRYLKQYVFLAALCIMLFFTYTLTILKGEVVRTREIATPNMESITREVNSERQLSIPTPALPIFSNKYISFGKYVAEKYLNAFSPNFLFLHGDGKQEFSVWYHGVFYLIDAFFIIIGMCVLFAQKKKIFYLLCTILLIAPLPSIVSSVGNSYAIRSMLLAPIFIIFIAVGIYYFIKEYPKTKYIVGILYGVLILNFLNIYFLRNPIYNSEAFTFSGRVLARYLFLENGPIYVINESPRTPYTQYLFYNNVLDRNSMNSIAKSYKNNDFSINNIYFVTCSQSGKIPAGSVIIYDKCKNISTSKKDVVIAQLADGGRVLTIHGGNLCKNYDLLGYPRITNFEDLRVESFKNKSFCEKFITQYK